MRLESPNGLTVELKDGLERNVIRTSASGEVDLPLGLSVAGAPVVALRRSVDVSFDVAAIKLLNTPATLVAAPAAGLALVFEGAVLFYDYGATAFTIGTASGLGIKYTDGSGLQVGQSLVTGLLDQTADKLRWIRPYTAASGDSSVVPVPASPLVLQMLTANVSGSVTGTVLRVRTYYSTIPATL